MLLTYSIGFYNINISLVSQKPAISHTNFNNFKSSIFYVGKGSSTRIDRHLFLAKKAFLCNIPTGKPHIDRIVNCWKKQKGVIILKFEHNSTNIVSHCKEAAIIANLGLNCLDNQRAGVLFGGMRNWSYAKLSNFGVVHFILWQLKIREKKVHKTCKTSC